MGTKDQGPRTRHSALRGPQLRRRCSLLVLGSCCLVPLIACARPRNIEQPVPGAVEITIADSVRYVVEAAARAIADEGIGVVMSDAARGRVESDWIDIGSVRTPLTLPVESYSGPERVVRFTFHARPTFGGSTVSAAAVYQPARSGGRATERMVPADHAARAVLGRMLEHVREYVDETRRSRGERAPPPRGH